jgi:hypothetical protein
VRLHVLTACSRPENLARVGESIAAAACEPWEVCWHVRFDLAREHVGGQALKNAMLDEIDGGWVIFLDDDTVLDPMLLSFVADNLAEMVVVSQRRADGRVLRAAPENMRVGQVDIGQAVLRRDLIGEHRIPTHYEGDGVFLADLAAAGDVRYIDEVLSHHNALERVPA